MFRYRIGPNGQRECLVHKSRITKNGLALSITGVTEPRAHTQNTQVEYAVRLLERGIFRHHCVPLRGALLRGHAAVVNNRESPHFGAGLKVLTP